MVNALATRDVVCCVKNLGVCKAIGVVLAGLAAWLTAPSISWAAGDAPVFSGPQAGERLPAFPAKMVVGQSVGESIDVAEKQEGQPARLLMIVHQLTRPSVAFARTLGDYAKSREADGLRTALVFLGADATALQQRVERAQHAMPQGVPVGISMDGAEGPGRYGLNRKVTMTVLLAGDEGVVFNQALIDPNLPTQLPPVVEAICGLIGGEPPEIRELLGRQMAGRGRSEAAMEQPPEGFSEIEPLLRRLIRTEATPEQVDEVARQIMPLLEKYPQARKRVKVIAGRVHDRYGTERARVYLRRWAGVDEQ